MKKKKNKNTLRPAVPNFTQQGDLFFVGSALTGKSRQGVFEILPDRIKNAHYRCLKIFLIFCNLPEVFGIILSKGG